MGSVLYCPLFTRRFTEFVLHPDDDLRFLSRSLFVFNFAYKKKISTACWIFHDTTYLHSQSTSIGPPSFAVLWRMVEICEDKSDIEAINVWLKLTTATENWRLLWPEREGRGKPKQMKLTKCRYFLLLLSPASRSNLSNLSGCRNVCVFLLFLNNNYVFK